MARCPRPSELEQFVEGRAGASSIAEHLRGCPACAGAVDEIRENQAFLRRAGGALAEAGTGRIGTPPPPPRVEGFQLLHEISRGGQGVVYRAVQVGTQRPAAVKMLLAGVLASGRQLRRFEREVEIAANLRHPNVVTVFESGVAEDGRRYVAMEFVEGVSLDRYLEEKLPSPAEGGRARVDAVAGLIARVAEGVGHAHSRGIIHRDLKPSNILVDERGEPKVLDFGLAREAEGLVDVTATREFVGTPAYAAPEQLAGESSSIGTRTDVYALGVILYVAITGHRPYPCDGSLPEVVRHVMHTEPAPLSSFVARVPADIETIALKALAKSPDRRYSTAEELASDLRDYLAGRPISARRDSTMYILQRLARRHRVPAAIGAGVVLLIAGAAVALAIQTGRLSEQKAQAEAVAEFQAGMLADIDLYAAGIGLTKDVLAQHEGALRGAGMEEEEVAARSSAFAEEWSRVNATDATLNLVDRTILAPASSVIDRDFAGQGLVQATLRQGLANRYVDLGLYDESIPLYEASLETCARLLGQRHERTLGALAALGNAQSLAGDLDGAEVNLRAAMEGRTGVLGGDHPDTLETTDTLAIVLQDLDRLEEAETLHRRAYQGFRTRFASGDPRLATARNNLATLLAATGELDQAEALYKEGLEETRRIRGNSHPETVTTLNNLGVLLQDQGRLGEAEPYLREALELTRRVRGRAHPETIDSLSNYGVLLQRLRRYDEAGACFREALEASRAALGDSHLDTLNTMGQYGILLLAQGARAEAEPLLTEAFDRTRATVGPEHTDTLDALINMGALRLAQDRHQDVVDALRPFEPAVRRAFAEARTHRTAEFLRILGSAQAALGEFSDASLALGEAWDTFEEVGAPTPDGPRACAHALAELYDAWKQAPPEVERDAQIVRWRAAVASFDEPVAADVGGSGDQ